MYAEIGKFTSIAWGARINPSNHPSYTRVAQHHFTYRSKQFGFAEEDDESKCTNLCALMLFEMLGRVTNESTVSYTLLKKKTSRAGYLKFIDLYKDIQAATDKIEKKKFWVRVKLFFSRNRDRFFRILLVVCLTAAVIALIMLISQLIFGDIPLFIEFFLLFSYN